MPKFSSPSSMKLFSCHPDLQVLFREVIKHFDCIVLDGQRSEYMQNKAYESGHSKLKFPASKHNKNPSMAVDVAPYPLNFDDTKLSLWFGGYVLGIAQKLLDEGIMQHSVRWGGAWDGLGKLVRSGQLNDPHHFELVEKEK